MKLITAIVVAVATLCSVVVAGELPSSNLTARAPSSWTHPGVLLNRKQLDFMRSKVKANQQPWAAAYKDMLSSDLASQSRQPSPVSTVACGYASQNPNIGCWQESGDALAAYANSLAWYITQDAKYAKKSIQYFNAWSYKIKAHTGGNKPLQTGWVGASWARAAEIIHHTYNGWSSADVNQFKNMLKNVYLPTVIGGHKADGNWELVMMEAAQGISVFIEDKASYDKAMSRFMSRAAAYVYLTSDGSYPKAPPWSGYDTKNAIVRFWHNQSTFVNGIAQETCRDLTHAGYGLASISNVAETSRIQGHDLYTGEIGRRLEYGLEFNTKYELGAAEPSWLCPGKTIIKGLGPVTEVGFNALHTRLGRSMPNTQKYTLKSRPQGVDRLFIGWETLTHAGNTA